MVFRVATYNTTNTIFNQTEQLEAQYANVNIQTSSGLKSTNFQGISSSAQTLLELESQNNNLTSQATVITSAQTRINTLESTVGTISSTIDEVNTLLTSVASGIDVTGGATANVAQASTLRDDIVSLLNSKIGPDYLFSGSNYDAAPVDITAAGYTPSSAPTTPNTSYYQGNGTLDSVRASDTLTVTYGVTAANPAFEQILRALTIFINNPTDPTTLSQATSLAQQATDGVANISGELGAQASAVNTQATLSSTSANYLQQMISTLRDADVTTAAVQASQIDTQLQASYSSLSKLLSLNLAEYLK